MLWVIWGHKCSNLKMSWTQQQKWMRKFLWWIILATHFPESLQAVSIYEHIQRQELIWIVSVKVEVKPSSLKTGWNIQNSCRVFELKKTKQKQRWEREAEREVEEVALRACTLAKQKDSTYCWTSPNTSAQVSPQLQERRDAPQRQRPHITDRPKHTDTDRDRRPS